MLANVFDFQDQIALHVATALEIKLVEGEEVSERRKRSREPLAYEKFVKARELFARFARQTHFQAQQLCNDALSIDANCTPALYLLGLIHVDQGRFDWVPDSEAAYEIALNIAEQAFKIDPDYADIYSIISYARTYQRRHDEAVEAADKAVQFSPNSASAFQMSAMAHTYAGNFNIAHNYELQYCRLSPMAREVALVELARAEFHLGKFGDAREHASKVLETEPGWLTAKTILLAALWRLGRRDDAKQLASEIRSDHPRFAVDRWARRWPYRDAEHLDALIEPLKSAGL
jgi:tetratricopeptide (TPR) repeat protein